MSPLDPLHGLVRSGPRPGAGKLRAGKKSSGGSGLGSPQQDAPRQHQKAPPKLTVELVCQGETPAFDPYWDGPRLVPAFVAQLLGQVMAPGRVAVKAYSAPGETGTAARLDTRL